MRKIPIYSVDHTEIIGSNIFSIFLYSKNKKKIFYAQK